MVYLRIFVLAACATFCLVQSEGPFVCPTCYAEGENADIDCEDNIEFQPCNREMDPVCVLVITTPSSAPKRRARYCASTKFYKEVKASCKQDESCRAVMCDASSCKVDLPA